MRSKADRLFAMALFLSGALNNPGLAQIDFQPVYDAAAAAARDRANQRNAFSESAADRAEARAYAADCRRVDGYNNSLTAGEQALDRKDAASLEAAAQEMLRLYPDDRTGLKYMGISLAMRGDCQAAENYYNQAKNAGMKEALWRSLMGNAKGRQARQYLDNGNPQAAESELKDALRYDDHADWLWNDLGIALERQGKLDEAAQSYAQAIRLDPNDPLLARNLKAVLEAKADQKRKTDDQLAVVAIGAAVRTFSVEPAETTSVGGALTNDSVGSSSRDTVTSGTFGTPVAKPSLQFGDPNAGVVGKDTNAHRQLQAIRQNDLPIAESTNTDEGKSKAAQLGFDTGVKAAVPTEPGTDGAIPRVADTLVIPDEMRADPDVLKLEDYKRQANQAAEEVVEIQAKFASEQKAHPDAAALAMLQAQMKSAQDKAENLTNMVTFQTSEVKKKVSFSAFKTGSTSGQPIQSDRPPPVH